MLITDLLCPQCIELHGRSGTKTEVIGHLIDLVMKSGRRYWDSPRDLQRGEHSGIKCHGDSRRNGF